MKIKWAPLNVPVQRRLQTLAAAAQVSFLLFGAFTSITLIAVLLIVGSIWIRAIIILYLAFIYYDRHIIDSGGRGAGSQWFRDWQIFKYFNDYFPVDLVKTTELPNDRHYLFAVFPHGILSSGVFANFNTNQSKWKILFPGIRSKLMTLNFHFYIPIFREVLLSWGMGSASKRCIKSLLTAKIESSPENSTDGYTSNGVGIVIGGAQEAFYSRPKNYEIFLRKRKGFVRIAIETGTAIVPVISFNEVDIYNQAPNPPGSLLRRVQEFVKLWTGVSPILIFGRGFFQYSFGLIPQRKPITTVVGAPIEIEKNINPTTEEISKIHKKFCFELNELFENHKANYIEKSENIHLIID